MRYRALPRPVRLVSCPLCLQGDAVVLGERYPDPDLRAQPDVSRLGFAGGAVLWGGGEPPRPVAFALDCGHELDADVWVIEPVGRGVWRRATPVRAEEVTNRGGRPR